MKTKFKTGKTLHVNIETGEILSRAWENMRIVNKRKEVQKTTDRTGDETITTTHIFEYESGAGREFDNQLTLF